ncbi:MAG: hypothetical protein MHM6MM_007674 [Cercozoa sp. M6MM]
MAPVGSYADPALCSCERSRDELFSLAQAALHADESDIALFWAEKLVSAATACSEEVSVTPRLSWQARAVLLLGKALFRARKLRRVEELLRRTNVVSMEGVTETEWPLLPFQLLLARALQEREAFDEALQVLGGDGFVAALDRYRCEQGGETRGIALDSLLAAQRARALESIGRRPEAIHWLQDALRRDVRNVSASDLLLRTRMLLPREEESLIRSLVDNSGSNRNMRNVEGVTVRSTDLALDFLAAHVAAHRVDRVDNRKRTRSKSCFHLPTLGQRVRESVGESTSLLLLEAQQARRVFDTERALSATTTALLRDAWDLDVLPEHALALLQKGNAASLYHAAHRLLALLPERAEAWLCAGAYYLCVGHPELAAGYLRRATELNDLGAVRATAWILLGRAHARCDRSDRALHAFRVAMQLAPGAYEAPLAAAAELRRDGRLEAAQDYLRMAEAAAAVSTGPSAPPILASHCVEPALAHERGVQALAQIGALHARRDS